MCLSHPPRNEPHTPLSWSTGLPYRRLRRGLSVFPQFPVGCLTSPSLDRVLGSAERAASPVHPAASAFSITLSTGTSRIGTSRHSLSPSSRASRRRTRCILCGMDHYAALTCPAELLGVQHPLWAAARTRLPTAKAGGFSVHFGGVFSIRSPKAPSERPKAYVSSPKPVAGCSAPH